jgi:hypothetical protein
LPHCGINIALWVDATHFSDRLGYSSSTACRIHQKQSGFIDVARGDANVDPTREQFTPSHDARKSG